MFLQYFYGRSRSSSSGKAGGSKDEAKKKGASSKSKLLSPTPTSGCIQTHSLEKLLENKEEKEGEAKEPAKESVTDAKVVSVIESLRTTVTIPARKVSDEKVKIL